MRREKLFDKAVKEVCELKSEYTGGEDKFSTDEEIEQALEKACAKLGKPIKP